MESPDFAMGSPSEPDNAVQPEILASTGDSMSQSNLSLYEELLSQPPDSLSHAEKLKWLQTRRIQTKIWVQCDDCQKWRYAPHVFEPQELPDKWYCHMNPDKSAASCFVAESPIPPHIEADLIHSDYSMGSVVLAKHGGWPWWPAMVDDCPDTMQYYWLDELGDVPTHFHVTFFDKEATRAWIPADRIKPFTKNKTLINKTLRNKAIKKRLTSSAKAAEEALCLDLIQRMNKFCFISRYEGEIKDPKDVENNKKTKKPKRKDIS